MIPETVEFQNTSKPAKDELPLIVDLDGTIIKSDLLFESSLLFIKRNILNVFLIFLWLINGRAFLKMKLSQLVALDVEALPYNKPFMTQIKKEFENGRTIILATASPAIYAKKIADYLGVFSSVIATDGKANLKGRIKLERLLAQYGEKGFDYAGDSNSDIVIFAHCRKAHLINGSAHSVNTVKKMSNMETIDKRPGASLFQFIKAIRLYQWAKNLLLFVPLITSHNLSNLNMFLSCIFGFFAFSFCASSTYIINDLFDLSSDRKHPRKKERAFANGSIPIPTAIISAIFLGISGILISVYLDNSFVLLILSYILLSFLYSFILKKQAIVDVMTLAGLYTIRIFAGAQIIGVNVSFLLFAFSVFLFFGLALIKRCTELQLADKSGNGDLYGRDYDLNDLNTLRSMGITSSFISVVVFALYINSAEVLSLYKNPGVLWIICPALLLWINRLWIKTGRQQMHDDPLIFTLQDMVSRLILLFIFLTVIIAQTI